MQVKIKTMFKFITFLFLFGPICLQAQTVILGRVISNAGEAVQGVNIYYVEGKTGTTTDSTGHFRLECELPCTLELSHVNYQKETYKLLNNRTSFVIVLRNKHNNLKEVIVTGFPASGKIFASSNNIERIPAILGEQDIMKYLATLPGIITTNALNSGIYVRGGNSNENGFLINDMPIANPDHLTGILSTFDPYIISNSTLYKSGFPARYNSFLSSYINMRPEQGNKQNYEGEITLGLVSSSIKTQGPIIKNKTSFAVSLRTSYLEHIARIYNQTIKDQQEPNYMPEYGFSDVTVSLDSKISGKWRMNAFGLFTIDNLKMKLSDHIQYKFNWHTLSGIVNTTYAPSSDRFWSLQVGMNTAYSKGDATGSIPMGGGNQHYSVLAKLSYSRSFSERIQFNTGGKFEYARFETANKMDDYHNFLIKSSDKSFNLSEIYADIIYQINPYFNINGGVNYQFYQGATLRHTFSPRFKISYTRGGFTLWMDYAKTAQYLSLYPYFTVKTPIDIWYPLEKNSKPAICHQYSIGINQAVSQILSVYAGVFYKDMRHVKDFASDIKTEYTALTENQIEGKGHAKGFEIDFTLNNRAFYAHANYTLSESKRQFKEINNGKSFYPPYDVKHNIIINFSYNLSSRLTWNALWSFSSGVYTTFPVGAVIAHNITDILDHPVLIPVYTDRYNYKLPNNHRLDADINYKFNFRNLFFKLTIGAYNIYNQSNPSFIYFRPERTGQTGTKFVPKSKVMLPFIPYISLRLRW